MLRWMCKSKIHRATVTDKNLNYTGSLTLDPVLMEKADIFPNEIVQIINLNTGLRIETYIIEGERNSGSVCMNGGAARWAEVGDLLIIISSALVDDKEAKSYKPKVVIVDQNNRIKNI
ncbi:aspartate 1-decarboxylase [bacterium Unc6]|nr:aspartate 1-decarboxylase [bacterium Unc6]